MTDQRVNAPRLSMTQDRLGQRAGYVAVLGLTLCVGAFSVPNPRAGLVMLMAGLTLLIAALLSRWAADRSQSARDRARLAVEEMVEHDNAIVLITDADGNVLHRNRAARHRLPEEGAALSSMLSQFLASPAAAVRRVQQKALRQGAAREDFTSNVGQIRLSAHKSSAEELIWRLEDIAERATTARGAETLRVAMMTVGKGGTVLYMNEAAKRLIGARIPHLDEILGDAVARDDSFREIRTETGPRWVHYHEIEAGLGRRELYLIPSDAPEAIQQRGSASPGAALDGLPVPLMHIRPDGMIATSNALARKLLGIDKGDQVFFGDLVEGLGRSVVDWLADAAEATSPGQSEFVRATRPTRDVFLQVSLAPLSAADGPGVIAILNDATKLKTLEAQFVQSQKMQAIGQLAGGVAHDFNNLLTAISGHCDLLMLRHDPTDTDYSDLQQIHQNANRAASLVGQLLAFSRKQTLKPEVLDVPEVLDDLTHLLNRLVGEKVTLELNHGADVPAVRADKRQLEQVLMNLVVNARDAMPNGGKIRVESRLEQLSEAYERDRVSVPPGDYVVILVHDEGMGIPSEKLPKIFEPFFTTKKTGEGTGLGLSMAYGIVKQTGGFIFADSVEGAGTTFTLFFPAKAQEGDLLVLEKPKKPAREVASADSGVVLLVEDEAPVRAFAARALKMRGFEVVEADCAEEALKTLEDPSLQVDVFVTDVIMPGMDGPSWVAEALKNRPDTRVVFVSGYAEDSFSTQQARIPNSVFLPKPFSLTDLTATVSQQLH